MSAAPKKSPSALAIFCGLLFTCAWIAAHIVWASLSFMGSVMANDSGAASADQHMSLITGMLGGQILAGMAGIPAGFCFFWGQRRKALLIAFAVLFLLGAAWQIIAFMSFTQAAANH